MCALQDEVAGLVDEGSLSACRSSPKHEDQMVASPVEGCDGGIGEGLPTFTAVAEGLMLANGETRVEQEYALFRPSGEVSTLGDGRSRLGLYLFEDVLERRREGYAVVHAEAQSVCLSRAVLRVLAQDNHTNFIERCRVESVEDESAGRVASARRILLPHKLCQLLKVRFVKLFLQLSLP